MSLFEEKSLGIIGGMGPLATDMFFNTIIRKTVADRDQDHINMIILNHASMPDRTEAIKKGNTDIVKNKLLKDAKFLEESGVGCIAVPCNTSHYILDLIKDKVEVPIISMIEMAVKKVKSEILNGIEIEKKSNFKVGIMATDGTLEMGLYQKQLENAGLQPVIPREEVQKEVMAIIYENVKKGMAVPKERFEKIDRFFKESVCDKVILACTELSVYKIEENLDNYYVDAMEALADEVIVKMGKKIREKY